jgi:hypothetical protein
MVFLGETAMELIKRGCTKSSLTCWKKEKNRSGIQPKKQKRKQKKASAPKSNFKDAFLEFFCMKPNDTELLKGERL